MEGRLRTCKRWKSVYSPALGKKVQRCAEFGEWDEYGDLMLDDYSDSGISSFFEDIGIDLEDIKGHVVAGVVAGLGLVGVSALMNKVSAIREFVADKPLVKALSVAGISILLAQLGKRFAPQYSEHFNALAIVGVGYAFASQLSAGIGVPLANLGAISDEVKLEAVAPEMEAVAPELEAEDEIDISELAEEETIDVT
ncbi:MAG: hypothetical protein QW156_04595 [Candidatus Aenigmatarchaeota archaeon]